MFTLVFSIIFSNFVGVEYNDTTDYIKALNPSEYTLDEIYDDVIGKECANETYEYEAINH